MAENIYIQYIYIYIYFIPMTVTNSKYINVELGLRQFSNFATSDMSTVASTVTH